LEPHEACPFDPEIDGVHRLFAASSKRKFAFSDDAGNVFVENSASNSVIENIIIMGKFISSKCREFCERTAVKRDT